MHVPWPLREGDCHNADPVLTQCVDVRLHSQCELVTPGEAFWGADSLEYHPRQDRCGRSRTPSLISVLSTLGCD